MAIKQLRPIRVEGNVAYVPLTRGYEAIIDAEDVPLVEGRNWFARVDLHTVYAVTNVYSPGGKQKSVSIHAALTGFRMTDHIDGNGLNNQRSNLRAVTAAENNRNRRANFCRANGPKGVSFQITKKKWRAYISVNRSKKHLGYFETMEAAAAAYAAASAELHGEFGRIA